MKKRAVLISLMLILLLSFNLVNAGILKVTEEHPFLVDNEWTPAKNLQVGDILQTSDGGNVTIKRITWHDDAVSVFNLESDIFHNFVLGDGLIVHNSNVENYYDVEYMLKASKEEKLDAARYFLGDESVAGKEEIIWKAHLAESLSEKMRILHSRDSEGNPYFSLEEADILLRRGVCGFWSRAFAQKTQVPLPDALAGADKTSPEGIKVITESTGNMLPLKSIKKDARGILDDSWAIKTLTDADNLRKRGGRLSSISNMIDKAIGQLDGRNIKIEVVNDGDVQSGKIPLTSGEPIVGTSRASPGRRVLVKKNTIYAERALITKDCLGNYVYPQELIKALFDSVTYIEVRQRYGEYAFEIPFSKEAIPQPDGSVKHESALNIIQREIRRLCQ